MNNSAHTFEPAVQGDDDKSDRDEETRDSKNEAGKTIHKVSRTGVSNSAAKSSDEEEGHK
jgi:hypothetical protein